MNKEQRYAALLRAAEDLARTPQAWCVGTSSGIKRCVLTHLVGPANLKENFSFFPDIESPLVRAGFTGHEIDTVLEMNDSSSSIEEVVGKIREEFGCLPTS